MPPPHNVKVKAFYSDKKKWMQCKLMVITSSNMAGKEW
jgi:hypothetical protein